MPPPCTRETERCEYWAWERDFLRTPCCSQHLTELLVFVNALLTRHHIFHWLDYGSLLGAVRSNDLIPWDDDGDIGCWRADLPRLLALEPEFRAAGFWLDSTDAPHILRVCYSRINILHVDLWLCRVENGMVKIVFTSDDEKYSFPIEYVKHLSTVNICGQAFPAPASVDTFLSKYRYGANYMQPTRLPASFAWTRMPSLRDAPDTPLLQYLLQEIRTYDYLLSSAPSHLTATLVTPFAPTHPLVRFVRYVRRRAAPLRPAFAKYVFEPTRRIQAYLVALPYWFRHRRSQAVHPSISLQQLSPTMALVILELHRRQKMYGKIKEQMK